MHPDASAPRERCTAIVVLWTRFLTFHLVRDSRIASNISNFATSKCSQRGFRKDKQRTSMMGSPLILSLTPRITTTRLTVTSRIHSLERMKVNLTKMTAPQTQKNLRIHKHPKPMSPVVHRHVPRQSRQLRLRIATGHPLSSRWTSVVLVNSIHSANNHLSRMGKVAIIRDIGAVTCV